MNRKELITAYKKRKSNIKKRLLEFKKMKGADRKKLFAELCFCLCTPQSKAVNCNEAVACLEASGALFDGRAVNIAKYLKGLVRFHNNKARYIVEARRVFYSSSEPANLSSRLRSKNKFAGESRRELIKFREWLVRNIKGLGMKEASHFLRNIGIGSDLAIIDRHILTNLYKYGAIYNIPEHISNKQYLTIEKKMRKFSKDVGIPLAELDLLFWSNQTGHVFK